MSTSDRNPLLLVEDDPELGPLVAEILDMAWDVTLVADAAGARAVLDRRVFAVIVVDRRLPDMDGADLVAWFRARGVSTPALMLTALGTVADKVSGLDAGANDYLVKPFEFEELEARLRALTRHHSPRGTVLPIGSWTLYPDDRSIDSPYSGRIMLTAKECALLALLAEHPDTVFSRDQLLTAVFDHGEQTNTVDTYVHYLRSKTEKELVETVRGRGYRLGTPL